MREARMPSARFGRQHMSSVVVLTPLIVAGWPVVTAAVTAAIGSMGFSVVSSAAAAQNSAGGLAVKAKEKNRTEIDVEDSEILANTVSATGANEIVVERDGVRAVFSRDARGALKLCME